MDGFLDFNNVPRQGPDPVLTELDESLEEIWNDAPGPAVPPTQTPQLPTWAAPSPPVQPTVKASTDKEEIRRKVMAARAGVGAPAPPEAKAPVADGDDTDRRLAAARQEEATRQEEKVEAELGEPLPLRRAIEEPSPCPVDCLPDVLKNAVYSLHRSIKSPLALCMNSALAAAALAVQGHADVMLDGRVYPISEYFVTIAESGERKSAVDREVLKPIMERQQVLRDEHGKAMAEYHRQYQVWKKGQGEILNDKEKGLPDREAALKELGPPPPQPVGYILKVEESTYQGLFNLSRDGQPSVGLFSDEGGLFLGGYSMQKETEAQMFSGLSKFWAGEPLTRATAGEGPSSIYGKRLSIHLMAQPGIVRKLLCNPVARDQGILARCLVTYPRTTIGTRMYTPVDLREDPAMQEYWAVISARLRREYKLRDGTSNELDPPRITLSAKAKRIWIEFHNSVEKRTAAGGPLEAFRDFGSKAPEHALRLAGVFALIEDEDAMEVGEAAVKASIEVVEFYLGEMVRIRTGLGVDPELEAAQQLLDWIHGAWVPKHGTDLCLEPLYQEGPSRFRSARGTKPIIRILEDHGWLVRYDGPVTVCGKNRKEAWRVRGCPETPSGPGAVKN